MKTSSTIQEILLITTTTFSKRQLCETDVKDRHSKLSPEEQLEAACWNGLLDEQLPEIMHRSLPGNKLFLWQVEMRKYSLSVIKADCPPVQDMWFALDPYVFLCHQEMN